MEIYTIKTANIFKIYLSLFLSLSLLLLSNLLTVAILKFFLRDVENESACYMVIGFILFFISLKIFNRYAYSHVEIKLNEEEIILKTKKEEFKCSLSDIKKYHLKFTFTNFPWFKVETHNNRKFKFNCKKKGDECYYDFSHHFVGLMENYDAQEAIK